MPVEEVMSFKVFRFHRSVLVLFFELLHLMLLPVLLLLLVTAAAPQSLRSALAGFNVSLLYRAVCVVLMLEIVRRYFNDLYVFGQRRIIHLHGQLSLQLQKISICYSDIREIKVRQTLLGRILNYGTVVFATAAKELEDMELRDVSHPYELAALAEKMVHPAADAPDLAHALSTD
jgi:membrane protein YdbS with pleckstrin-like domain